ncbi:MAG: SufD family Fe-S cluster assembly protein [Planctomycetales bacterium]|nr:SufD family Fe-S cluster assembly protein [bacterium]UNM07610.1 MAG: SufD family Fe-S cluster assembly protein [Planctomycetales bacterium]
MSGSSETQSGHRGNAAHEAGLPGLRQRYAELAAALPLPDLRTESWHYGRPDKFLPEQLTQGISPQASNRSLHVADMLQHAGPAIVLRLGIEGLECLQGSMEDFGGSISLLDEHAGFSEHPALQGWLESLNQRESDKLEAEQLSRLQRVMLLDMSANSEGGLPLHLIVDMPGAGLYRSEQIVVNAQSGSACSLHLHITGDDIEEQSLLHLGLHLELADNSSLKLLRYQNTGTHCDVRGIETQHLGRDARCTSVSLFVGGRHLRHDAITSLAGPGSESVLRGLYHMGGRQTASIFSHQDHRVANAHSDLLFKGTMLDRSAASYLGQITVAPDAQGTDAYQSNRSLLLSPKARSSSSPQLEIEANDVRCSHGASVANVSSEELFYLESRGIDPETGRQLLVSGFLAEVADLVPEGRLREYVYGDMLGRRV